jgi:predicted transcriptional regulator
MPTKISSSLRLTPHAKKLLAALAEHLGLTQTSVIETAIRQMAKREKIEVTDEAKKEVEE